MSRRTRDLTVLDVLGEVIAAVYIWTIEHLSGEAIVTRWAKQTGDDE